MSAIAELEPGLPDQEQEGGGMGHDARQIVLHVLPIEDAIDDMDGTVAFLVSQAVMRAIAEEGCGQEEIWPDVEEIWPHVEDIWPEEEEVWPDVEEDWYIWNDQENEDFQREAEYNQYYNDDDDDDDNDDDDNNDDDDDDDDYEYEDEDEDEEDEDEDEGEEQDEVQGEEIILHACKASRVQSLKAHRYRRGKDSSRSTDLTKEA